MSSTADQVLTGPRLSSAVRCPRMAVYQGLDIPQPELTIETQRLFRRGHALADVAKQQIAEGRAELFPDERPVEFEVEIPWPADAPVAVGHADLYIPDEEHIVEIVTAKDCDLPEVKALQVTGYVHEHPTAVSGSVLSIDPSSGEERLYPINVEALAPKWLEIRDKVVVGLRDDDGPIASGLPDRVCRHPNDGPAMFCPFGGGDGHCFREWTPDVEHVDAEPAFRALADLEDLLSTEKSSRDEELKAERDDLRAEVLAHVDPGGGEYVSGGVSVRVTEVKEGETFSLADMKKAGFALPPELEAFVKPRKASQRWTVKRVEPDGS